MMNPSTSDATTLLDADFVRQLEALRRRLQIRARSGLAGEHLANRRGGSAEFHEHRPYTAGDDMRRIDWAAYARSGQPVIKVFRAEEDVVARLLCDGSASLGFGAPPKIDSLRRLAAAIGYMTLAESERAQVIVARGDAVQMNRPCRGRGGLAALLRTLSSFEPGGKTMLSQAVDTVIRQSARPGMLVVLSDFFDGGPIFSALDRAAAAGHDVVLAQILAPEEIAPSYDGDWTFEDAETGELVELTLDAASIEAYLTRLTGLCEELRAWARKHDASYVRLRTDEAIEPIVRSIVSRSVA